MIKLCGVRTVEDALLCAGAGADEIGVIFAPKSKRRVTVETAKRIRDALPRDLPLVGVFLDAPLDEVERTAREAGLAAAQLHGAWPASRPALKLYAALQVTGRESLQPRPGAARLLLDGPSGGSGKSFVWSLAREVERTAPLFIAGGLTPENVAQAIREARPDGVDVASGIENEQGFKDPDKVRAFVTAARQAFK
jgi:phosphoribosylanthranilate isomerase